MKRNMASNVKSLPLSIFIGVLVSLVVTLISAGVQAFLIAEEKMTMSTLGYGALLTVIISVLTGSVTGILTAGNKHLLVSLITAGAYFLCLLSVTALFFGGQYENLLPTLIAVLGSGLAAALLSLRFGSGNNRTGSKYKSRKYVHIAQKGK